MPLASGEQCDAGVDSGYEEAVSVEGRPEDFTDASHVRPAPQSSWDRHRRLHPPGRGRSGGL
jgi:hypothetical protein